MAHAMKRVGNDVLLTEITDIGHNTWTRTYNRMEFYNWLVSAQRGQPPDSHRPTPAVLSAALNTPPSDSRERLQHELSRFANYWWLTNCGESMQPGLKTNVNGKRRVFLTEPLTPEIPCLLRTGWTIPQDRKASLHLIVSCQPQGEWRLVVVVNHHELLSQVVNEKTTTNGWLDTSVDLTAYAGQDIDLEVKNAATTSANAGAYWATLALEIK
jgi:hypothetical protein